MRVLVVDIGGTNVKILATGQKTARRVPSGPKLTPAKMVADVKALAAGWEYDAVTLGYPGRVHDGKILVDPKNLGKGWVGFDFKTAFGCPVQIMNDAAMQALGSYKKGLLLFLGLGTGLGAALVTNGVVIPLELAHLSFKDRTYEHYLGVRGLRRMGRKRWQKCVEVGTARMIEAVMPDDVVLGGGNTKKLKKLPKGCRAGHNGFAFAGGFRAWNGPMGVPPKAPRASRPKAKTASRTGRAGR